MSEQRIFTPIQTFKPDNFTLYERKVTFVREGHPILDKYGHMFEEVTPDYEWPEVEQATSNPGQKRGVKV